MAHKGVFRQNSESMKDLLEWSGRGIRVPVIWRSAHGLVASSTTVIVSRLSFKRGPSGGGSNHPLPTDSLVKKRKTIHPLSGPITESHFSITTCSARRRWWKCDN